MIKKITLAALILLPSIAMAQTSTSSGVANSGSASDAGAAAHNMNVFEAAQPHRTQRVHTTPPVYTAPSGFGYSNNNCGASDTMAVSITGFGIGGSKAGESVRCNTRQDVATAWNLGLQDVAVLRFACFGEPENRLAYEAAGYSCPAESVQTTATTDGYSGNDPIILRRLGYGSGNRKK